MVYQQLFHFVLVGCMGALIDFSFYSACSSRWIGMGRIPSSLVSTSCAMLWSFTANWLLVFQPMAANLPGRITKFLAVTCFSGWVLQSLVIYALARFVMAYRQQWVLAYRLIPAFTTSKIPVYERSFGKLSAMGVGLVWNFIWYRWWVYSN